MVSSLVHVSTAGSIVSLTYQCVLIDRVSLWLDAAKREEYATNLGMGLSKWYVGPRLGFSITIR